MTTQPDCEAVQIAAMALADGEAPLLSNEQVLRHTQTCAACRDDLAQRELLPTGLGRPREQVDLWPAIQRRLATQMSPAVSSLRSRMPWRLALSLAVVLLLLVASMWIYLSRQGERVVVSTPLASPKATTTPHPEMYEIPFDPAEDVDEAEYVKKFAVYFEDDFQRTQVERLGDDVDVDQLHPVTIRGRDQPQGTLFLNRRGEVVLAIKQPYVVPFREGLAAVATFIDKPAGHILTHYGFVDRTGRLAIPGEYDYADWFSEGLAAVRKGRKFGYINKQGEMVIPPQYQFAEPFADGMAQIHLAEGNEVQLIDRTGKVLKSSNQWDMGRFSEGLMYVNGPGRPGFDSGRARGYVDRDFEFVFRLGEDSSGFWPLECKEFHDGMAAIEIGCSNRWSFIDREGKLAAPGPFEQVQPFSEGRALVLPWNEDRSAARLWGYIDHHGEFIIEPKFHGATSYKEGLAAVLLPLDDAPPEPGALPKVKWGYIDVAGRTRIEPRFYRAEPFENGLAQVSENPRHIGFIDKTGAYVWQVTRPFE